MSFLTKFVARLLLAALLLTIVAIPKQILANVLVVTEESTEVILNSNQTSATLSIELIIISPTVYLIERGTRRGFSSPGEFFSHGFTFDQVSAGDDADLSLPEGLPMTYREGALFKSTDNPTVYIASDNKKRPFVSGDIFTGLGYKFTSIFVDSSDVISKLPLGEAITTTDIAHPSGTLVNYNGTICKIILTGRACIPTIETFYSYGFRFTDVTDANTQDLDLQETSTLLSRDVVLESAPQILDQPLPILASTSTTVLLATSTPTSTLPESITSPTESATSTPTSTIPIITPPPSTTITSSCPVAQVLAAKNEESKGQGKPGSTTDTGTTTPPPPPSPTTDTTAPIISNIIASDIRETSAKITWTTDEMATSDLRYWRNSSNVTSSISVIDLTLITSHSINLTDLNQSTAYAYCVVAKDASGNSSVSSINFFTTLTPPPPPLSYSPWLNAQLTNYSGDGNLYYGEYPALTWTDQTVADYAVVWVGNDGTPSAENIFFQRFKSDGSLAGKTVKLTNHGYCTCITAFPPNIYWDGSQYKVGWIDMFDYGGEMRGYYTRRMALNPNGQIMYDAYNVSVSGQTGTFVGNIYDYYFYPSYNNGASLSVSAGKIYFNSQNVSNELVSTAPGSNSLPFLIWTGEHFAATWMNVQNNQPQLYFGVK